MKEGKIWGDFPSKSALYCLELFKKYNIRKILIPGSGYGRNTKLFSGNKYQVVGIEISESAFNMSKDFDPQTEFVNGSVLEMRKWKEKFDAIFCFNVLHLFTQKDRTKFLKLCFKRLSPDGVCFFTVFSDQELSFGIGKKIEINTFESKSGRPTHYFTEDDLISHFRAYHILEKGIIEEQENHGPSGEHVHKLRYIFARK
jgi:SAM-dependent methyltransferase